MGAMGATESGVLRVNKYERELYNAVVNALMHCNDGPCKNCPCYDERACQLFPQALDLVQHLAEKVEEMENALHTDD